MFSDLSRSDPFFLKGAVPMIDIHCHILPGVDDSVSSLDDALLMARIAVASGVSTIIATPHSGIHGAAHQNFKDDATRDAFIALQKAVLDAGLKLRIIPGAEIRCSNETPRLLREGQLLTLAGTQYLLVDFAQSETGHSIGQMLTVLMDEGVTPVLAHPERYDCVQLQPELLNNWLSYGTIFQCNKGSILGRFGKQAQLTAEWMLHRNMVHLIASDAHGPYSRTPDMNMVRHVLDDNYGENVTRLLLEDNPNRILRNQPVLPMER